MKDSRSKFINYLNNEIEYLQNKINRPGWTKWAILGALATITWLLLNEIVNISINKSVLIKVTIATSFLFDGLSVIKYHLTSMNTKQNNNGYRFLISKKVLTGNRIIPILNITRHLIIFLLFLHLNINFDLYFNIIIYFYLSVDTFIYLIFLILSYLKFPIPIFDKNYKWYEIMLNLLQAIICFYVSAFFLRFIFIELGIVPIQEIKIVLLLFGFYYLLEIYYQTPIYDTILDSLVMIRRDLSLNNIDLKTAKEQTDVAVSGLKITQVLREYVSDFLDILVEAYDLINSISIRFDYLENNNNLDQRFKNTNLSKSDHRKIIYNEIKELKNILNNKIPDKIGQLEKRIEIIQSFIKGPHEGLDNVQSKVDIARKSLKYRVEELNQKIKTVMDYD